MNRWPLLLLLIGTAHAQDQQQRFIPGTSAQQYDEPDEIALREYVDVRIDALDRSVQTALTNAKEAVLKAENATESRFAAVNEFRASLADVTRVQMPRAEAEQQYEGLSARITTLTDQVNGMASRSQGVAQLWPILFGVFGVVVGIFGIFMALRKPEPIVASRN